MRTRFTTAALILASLIGTGAALAPAAHAESSPSAFASRLVQLINNARANNGLRALTVASGTSTVAANWTDHLASQRALSHNPDLGPQLESHGSPNWTSYGENVGEGPTSSAQTLFNAYMNSPEHRANILGSSYRYLGVGVVFSGSTAWNTLDFVDQYSGTTRSSSPTVVHHTTAAPVRHTTVRRSAPVVHHTAPKATNKAAHRPKPALPVHPASPVHPQATVQALSSTLPALPVPAAPKAAAAPTTLPSSPGHSPAPAVIAALVLLVTATRFVRVLRPRAA